MWDRVPILDLEQFHRDEDNRVEFANSFGQAMTTVGFVRLRGHGVSTDLLADCYQRAAGFFTASEETKMRLHLPDTKGQRGYTPFGREHARDNPAPDLKEYLMFGPEHYGANPVAPHDPGFNAPFLQLMSELDRVGLDCLRAAAIFSALPDDFFAAGAVRGNSSLRVLHYPPISEEMDQEMPQSVRSSEHADINAQTVMPASVQMDVHGNIVVPDSSGLQILTPDGWLDVPCVAGELVVNTGDMLQRFTNGAMKSTRHRVIKPPCSGSRRLRRLAMPYFLHFRQEQVIDPPGCFRGDGWPQPEPPIRAIDYLMQRLQEIGLA